MRTYNNIPKNANGQGNNYTTGCLLDYPYFEKYCKLTAADLSKQQKVDADQKTIQQISFTENLEWDGMETFFFIIGKASEKILDFTQGTARVL